MLQRRVHAAVTDETRSEREITDDERRARGADPPRAAAAAAVARGLPADRGRDRETRRGDERRGERVREERHPWPELSPDEDVSRHRERGADGEDVAVPGRADRRGRGRRVRIVAATVRVRCDQDHADRGDARGDRVACADGEAEQRGARGHQHRGGAHEQERVRDRRRLEAPHPQSEVRAEARAARDEFGCARAKALDIVRGRALRVADEAGEEDDRRRLQSPRREEERRHVGKRSERDRGGGDRDDRAREDRERRHRAPSRPRVVVRVGVGVARARIRRRGRDGDGARFAHLSVHVRVQ